MPMPRSPDEGDAHDDWMAVPQPGRVAVAQNRQGTVLGTALGAFDHPRHGRVGLHILWKEL